MHTEDSRTDLLIISLQYFAEECDKIKHTKLVKKKANMNAEKINSSIREKIIK